MKFSIQKKQFSKAIATVSRSISKRVTIPVLAGIRIEAKKDQLVLTGSDADTTVILSVPSDKDNQLRITEAGSIVLKDDFFSKVVKALPNGLVKFSSDTDNYRAKVIAGRSHFKLVGLNPNDYPHVGKFTSAKSLAMSSDSLRSIIGSTLFCASKQQTRPMLTGVDLTYNDDHLHAVSTDSRRLASYRIKITKAGDEIPANDSVIIPAKSLQVLDHLMPKETVPVKIDISAQGRAMFTFGDIVFYSRLIAGNYPQTDQLIPKKVGTIATMDVEKLSSAIQQASIISHASSSNVISMDIEPSTDSITVKTTASDVGDTKLTVGNGSVEGHPLQINCNPDYLTDALKAVQSDTAKIGFTSNLRPFLIKPTDDNGDHYVQLVTPIRTF